MRTTLSLALVLAAGWGSARDDKPAPEPKLEGTWEVVTLLRGGVPRSGGSTEVGRVTFDKDGGCRLLYRHTSVTAQGITVRDDREEVGTFRATGGELDLLDKDGKAVRQKGIYKFEKGALVVAFGAERPKGYELNPSDRKVSADQWVVTLRPAKK